MAISLGGVTLPDLVMDTNFRFGDSGLISRMNESRGGVPLIFEQQRGYKNLDLVGDADAGWATYETLLGVQALAAVPEASYTLSYEGTDYTVKFRNWDTPVIDADPLVPRPNPENSDWYNNVIIKLIVEV